MVQVKCIAQWLVKSEDSVSGSERKTEEQFLLGSISGMMRTELRISHPKGESIFAYIRSLQGPHANVLSL